MYVPNIYRPQYLPIFTKVDKKCTSPIVHRPQLSTRSCSKLQWLTAALYRLSVATADSSNLNKINEVLAISLVCEKQKS